MVELDEQATSVANRHIIERPRLTRLLDETTARVIMLVAPAGYGKTTLARQWLASRPHVWYAARPSSADMATLGIGVIEATEGTVPNVGSRFREWLSARRGAEDSVRAADLIVDDLSDWPEETWFAIDDYQFLTPDAEQVIDRVRTHANVRLVLTSRRRPLWCNSRDLLYGTVFEVDTATLKMNDEEAVSVLRSVDQKVAQDLIALAAGWPAIIGLASYANGPLIRDRHELPPELHDYIADELFASVAEDTREKLAQVSLLPSISIHRARQLLGREGDRVVKEGTRVGFLTDDHSGVLSMHPLLRAFLRRKMLELPDARLKVLVDGAVRLLISEREWDDAFEVIRQFDTPESLDELLAASLYELLECGHLKTVSTFVEMGRMRSASDALLDLADAELAFREGFHERARRLAERAALGLAERSPLASKALSLAGNSAYFSDAIDNAITSFQRAREVAGSHEDERRAVWGLFLAALEQEDESAAALLGEFEEMSSSSADELVRIQNGRLHFGTRLGTLNYGLSGAQAVAGIVSDAKDPVVRASFWHVYAAALRAGADYSGALEASDNALREITVFDLNFGRAHVYLTRAGALMGTAAHDEALALLDEVSRTAARNGDTYLQMNERTSRCKLFLLAGETQDAVRVTEARWPHVGSRGQFAEFLASRAIALAASGAREAALEILQQAENTSHENEATALCTTARALVSVDHSESFASILPRIRAAVSRGVMDPFVFAARLDRRFPRRVSQFADIRSALHEVLIIANAVPHATAGGLRGAKALAAEHAGLTRREREVLGYLAEGKTNREIASLLFLSESTVKVHVRHVLRKIGVRTRTEAAIYALTTLQPGARE